MESTTVGMFGDISCLIIDDSLDEGGKFLIYRQEVTIVRKLNHFHEHSGEFRAREQTWFPVSRSHCALQKRHQWNIYLF